MTVLLPGGQGHGIRFPCRVNSADENCDLAREPTQTDCCGAHDVPVNDGRRRVHRAIGPGDRDTQGPPVRVLDHNGTPAFAIPDLADERQWSADEGVSRQGDGHPLDNLDLQTGILI